MPWDTSKPADTDFQRDFPALDRQDKTTLQQEWNQEHQALGSGSGVHKFPIVPADPTGLEGRAAIVGDVWKWFSSGQWRTFSAPSGGTGFPAGTVMLFLPASAPTGWVRVISADNTG